MNLDKPRLVTRDFLLMFLATFTNSFCFQMLNATLALYSEALVGADSGVSGLISGIASIVFTIAIIVARPLAGYMIDRIGSKAVCAIGAALFGISCLFNAWIATIAALIICRIFQGLGSATTSTVVSIGTIRTLPPERMAEGVGKIGIGSNLSMVVGPPIALLLISGGSFRLPFYAVFICCCITLGAVLLLKTTKNDVVPEEHTRSKTPIFWRLIERRVLAPAMIQLLIMTAFASYTTFLTIYAQRRGYGSVKVFFAIAALTMIFTQLF